MSVYSCQNIVHYIDNKYWFSYNFAVKEIALVIKTDNGNYYFVVLGNKSIFNMAKKRIQEGLPKKEICKWWHSIMKRSAISEWSDKIEDLYALIKEDE